MAKTNMSEPDVLDQPKVDRTEPRRAPGLSFVAFMSVVLLFFVIVNFAFGTFSITSMERDHTTGMASTALRRLDFTDQQLQRIISELNSIAGSPQDIGDAALISRIEARLTALEDDLGDVREIVMENPERAMAIPIIRSDVNRIERSLAEEVVRLRADIARVDSFFWVVMSALIAILLAFLTFAIVPNLNVGFGRRTDRAGSDERSA